MGTTCCQGRGQKPTSPLLSSPTKVNKKKRRASMRVESLRTRGLSMSEPPKHASDQQPPGSFTAAFQKLLKTTEVHRNSHRGSDPTSENRSEASTPVEQKAVLGIGELSPGEQLAIQKLLFNTEETALGVYQMEFGEGSRGCKQGRALLSSAQVYLFAMEDNFTRTELTVSLDALTVLCLCENSCIFVLSDSSPDTAFIHLSSVHICVFLKAVEAQVQKQKGRYVPLVVFEEASKMKTFVERLSTSEIEALQSQEALKTLELILTTSGDLRESRLLQQPCLYHGQQLQFLLTSRRFYLLSKDFRVIETRKLTDVTCVDFSQGEVRISGAEWRVEVEMQDCAKVIELAQKTAK